MNARGGQRTCPFFFQRSHTRRERMASVKKQDLADRNFRREYCVTESLIADAIDEPAARRLQGLLFTQAQP
jgi:hypothetical protein